MIAIAIGVYYSSSLGGLALVKYLNYHYCFSAYVLLALLSRCTWLLSYPLHLFLQRNEGTSLEGPSGKTLKLYVIIAVGLTLVEVLNAASMTVLPGSWYALLKGSDVAWSMALSRIILHKKFPLEQVGAAMIVICGVGTVLFLDGASPKMSDQHAESTHATMMATHISPKFATVLCLTAAFVNALCAVVTEATLKSALKEEEEKLVQRSCVCRDGAGPIVVPSKLLLSNVYSMYTTFFSFLMLTVAAAWVGELQNLTRNVIESICDDYHDHGMVGAKRMVFACLFLLAVSRFTERLSKHCICVLDSAMTFSLVQAARRLSGVFVMALLFKERFTWPMLIGSLLCAFGFGLHWHGSLQEKGEGKEVQRTYGLIPEIDRK